MAGLKKSLHLKLELKQIEEATENFKTLIGKGGFGRVYKGELTLNGKHTIVAVKRFSSEYNVSDGEYLKSFLTEIQMLTGQAHPNLISLLGYCENGDKMILIYEYAAHGSLDRYLPRHGSTCTTITWVKRLEICVGAARGLDHLHRHVGEHQGIIHRDVKPQNILLDDNWVAKISDLGLSKLFSFEGLDRSGVVTKVCGTFGYCDPEYRNTGILKKESDVYSFGVVLFEVMCGRLCETRDNIDGLFFTANLAKDYYEKHKLGDIIDPRISEEMSPSSLSKFSSVAYNCLNDVGAQRPPMQVVMKELEEILKIQMEYETWKKEEEYWKMKLPNDSEEILQRLNRSALEQYSTRKDLFMLLHKGFFFDNDERFFSIDDDGKKCEMISAKGFVKHKLESPQNTISGDESIRSVSSTLRSYPLTAELNLYFQICTSMLSVNTMYAADLEFSFEDHGGDSSVHLDSSRWVWIKWKCEELCVSSAHFATRRDDGNFKTTLWHFFNSDKNAYFDIILNRLLSGEDEKLPYIIIHGLEFQPINEVMKSTDEIEEIKIQDFDWRNKLPRDYQEIIYRSDTHLVYTTEKELYFLLCVGILIDNGRKWFSLRKSTGEKCYMLPAVDIFRNDSNYELMYRIPLSGSRFKEGLQLQNAPHYYFTCELEANMFSCRKLYAIYLVFKFVDGATQPNNWCLLEAYCEPDGGNTCMIFAHLNSREPIPIIKPKKKNTKLRNLWKMPKTKGSGVPKWCVTGTHNWMIQRPDGWMEVLLCKPFDELEKYNSLNIKLHSLIGSFYGIIVQGIEFRPMESDI